MKIARVFPRKTSMTPNDKAGPDLYKILKLPNFASFSKVQKAYRELVLKHHPDRGGNEEGE